MLLNPGLTASTTKEVATVIAPSLWIKKLNTERLSNLPKVTDQRSDRVRVGVQPAWNLIMSLSALRRHHHKPTMANCSRFLHGGIIWPLVEVTEARSETAE
jgi:hypothetical protein